MYEITISDDESGACTHTGLGKQRQQGGEPRGGSRCLQLLWESEKIQMLSLTFYAPNNGILLLHLK